MTYYVHAQTWDRTFQQGTNDVGVGWRVQIHLLTGKGGGRVQHWNHCGWTWSDYWRGSPTRGKNDVKPERKTMIQRFVWWVTSCIEPLEVQPTAGILQEATVIVTKDICLLAETSIDDKRAIPHGFELPFSSIIMGLGVMSPGDINGTKGHIINSLTLIRYFYHNGLVKQILKFIFQYLFHDKVPLITNNYK